MPDPFGNPTIEELTHYSELLSKAEETLQVLRTKPFDRTKFDNLHAELEGVYKRFTNPYISAPNAYQWTPMYDIPRALKNFADLGRLSDQDLHEIRRELDKAQEFLAKHKAR